MRSMTGYSYAEFQDENIKLAAELKSYNNRFLDITVNAPPALQGGRERYPQVPGRPHRAGQSGVLP